MLTEQTESRIEEGHLMLDHVHMMIAIPPKYSVRIHPRVKSWSFILPEEVPLMAIQLPDEKPTELRPGMVIRWFGMESDPAVVERAFVLGLDWLRLLSPETSR